LQSLCFFGMNLFFAPDIDNELYTLSGEESTHCVRVLRLSKGDEIFLTDGKGTLFSTRIISDDLKKCTVQVVKAEREYGKRNYYLHIAIAPTKNIDRIEWFLEKATEIGIDEITPLICEHSERRTVNMERMNRVITAAMKQSLKAYLPLLNKEMKFNDFVKQYMNNPKFIAHYNADNIRLTDALRRRDNAVILIGPEGDFNDVEIKKATEHGYKPVNLGNNRYRTETAALVACSTLSLMNE
jgi:16S rRNA (uracil1498-N3)-methyltransferase